MNPTAKYHCRWAWCRETFLDAAGLSGHVVSEHVRRAIPVRRRDVAILRRAEEGTGESWTISGMMNPSLSSNPSAVSAASSKDAVNPIVEPSSSLPSPPASSPAFHSPAPQAATSPELCPITKSPQEQENSLPSPASPESRPKCTQATSYPPFGSLTSPAGSNVSVHIPSSPSFRSMVHASKRRKIDFGVSTSLYPIPQQSLSASPDRSTTSSISQASVEQQLTQSLDMDYEDDIMDVQGFSVALASDPLISQTFNPTIPNATVDSLGGSDLYRDELQWCDSRVPMPMASVPSYSQPPSQLQLHNDLPLPCHVDPHATNVLEDELQSGGPLGLSSPKPASPNFAASTPHRQNWYQPPLLQTHSMNSGNDVPPVEPNSEADTNVDIPARHTSPPPKTKTAFRSGMLQIKPASLPVDSHSEVPPATTTGPGQIQPTGLDSQQTNGPQTLSQPSLDSSQSVSQDYSYPPLQTQAPYHSQSFSPL